MQKGNGCTVGRWCYRWFCENQSRWSDSTVGGYRNLIYRHILPEIGSIPLAELSENTVTGFYDILLADSGFNAPTQELRPLWPARIRPAPDRGAPDNLPPDSRLHPPEEGICQG